MLSNTQNNKLYRIFMSQYVLHSCPTKYQTPSFDELALMSLWLTLATFIYEEDLLLLEFLI